MITCWKRNLLLLAAANGVVSTVSVFAFTTTTAIIKKSPGSALPVAITSAPEDTSISAATDVTPVDDEITDENPLRVVIAGAGVGGLALANALSRNPRVKVTVLERTDQFKRFGGPIQLASNALEIIKTMDRTVFDNIMNKFTYTGDKENGIKDGIRSEWYAKFDLGTPAEDRGMPYTGVIDRPDLQQIYLDAIPTGVIRNGDGVASYTADRNGHGGGVKVTTDSNAVVEGDVLIGADGIWSAVRATMRDEPAKGDGSGVTYSGYTVFAGELEYASPDNGAVGYKVYIGPGQYFVITDIGNGCYQWYAFLAREPGSAERDEKPEGSSVKLLKDIFVGWSPEVHAILDETKEHEIEQRDLYDRPPSVLKRWTDGNVALLGDSVHAMMPNLGQGGCQAIEDAYVLSQELSSVAARSQIDAKLRHYRSRRLIRSAAVQGLSRFASDVIIKGFDTPAKISRDEATGQVRFENFNYAGVVTKMLQPILPLFFKVQFDFLYDGWKNEMAIDAGAAVGFFFLGGTILLLGAGSFEGAGVGLGLGLEGLFGAEGLDALLLNLREFFTLS